MPGHLARHPYSDLPDDYRSSRSSVGMPFVTLCVTDLRCAICPKKTRSVQDGIPTRSMGTIVFARTPRAPPVQRSP
ncbi:hypothetical protein CXB37_12820 [Pseudomonas syringae pv. syringae]|nr:hypothetical protein CXB37_12820 [Pseudomonas syringae pv. syringae]